MAMLIAEMAAERAGEVLCGELLRRGLNPTAMTPVKGGGDVLIALTILGDWSKGFVVDSKQLSPDQIESMLENWKAKVRKDIEVGQTTPPVRQALARYGRTAVDAALAPRYGRA